MIQYTINHLLAIFIVFILAYCVQTKLNFSIVEKISKFLISRGLFYRKELENGDDIVINVVRILLGCLLFFRLISISEFTLPLDPSYQVLTALYLYAILIALFTVGLLAPLVTLLLLLFQLYFNFKLRTYTLGIDVTAMILVCMVLYPVGRSLSVDSTLLKNKKVITSLYAWFSFADRPTQVVAAKAIAFYSYCLLCLYSVVLHLDEPLWMNGEAAIHLLSSSYLSTYYIFFQDVFSSSSLAVLVAKASMVGMVIWYFILGPAVVIGGWLRVLVFIWTLGFFVLSTFFLQLSILGYIEFLFFTVLFWINASPRASSSVNMLFDDRCNLCQKTVSFLRIIDIARVLNFRPISKNEDKAKLVGVSAEQLRNDLYSWDESESKVHSGYNFYLHSSRRLIVLYPLYPVLMLFKWVKIGPMVYRYIANRRIQMFGVCQLPDQNSSKSVDENSLLNLKPILGRGFFKPFVVTSIIFSIVFILIFPPVINPFYNGIKEGLGKNFINIVRSAHILSWTRINVFNEPDLKMTHHYFTVQTVGQDRQLLPYTGVNGTKLEWHKSDRVYYGNSLHWRRIKNKQALFPVTKRDVQKFCEVWNWAKGKGFNYTQGLEITHYKSDWPKFIDGKVEYSPAEEVGKFMLTPNQCS